MSMTDGFTTAPPGKLAVEHVSKWFRTTRTSVHALDDVNLHVEEGGFVCLLGPSGCGKSTLLDIIAGLTLPDEGQVLANDILVQGPGRHRLVMFQESALFPWLNVFGNVMFGLRRTPGLGAAQRRQIADYHLHLVGLAKFKKAYVHELSGGMKQRAALARSLAPDPRVLLMDEPFASLDGLTREHLYFDLQRIWQERKKTIVLVTHNVRGAACLGDRVLLMSPSPGRIREEFVVDLPRPRDINTAAVAAIAYRITGALKGMQCDKS
jgi:NitT/TauT family transport system ATP-binding protein